MAEWNAVAMQRGLTLLFAPALWALLAAALLLLGAACSDSSGGGTAAGETETTDTDPSSDSSPDVEITAPVFHAAAAFPALTFSKPVAMVQAPGDDAAWFVVEQAGRVWRFANDPAVATRALVADLTAAVDDGPNEAGLLGMAFHPDFASNGEVFLSYTAPGSGGGALTSRVSRFAWDEGTGTLDMASEEVLLAVSQPYGNHNGGHVVFGPDGYLYIGLGDGGSAGDPDGNGQNTGTLLGAILRIDVDGGAPYAIPADNPFAAGGGRGELYAWGFRNPWRFSFDAQTGALWAGDVGQAEREEVDRVVAGGNHGWAVKEGTACYGQATCDGTGLTDPVTEYTHADGCSITGGYVYRGGAIAQLDGYYLYGDYCSGTLWAYNEDAGGGVAVGVSVSSGLAISSFAQDADGELYLLDHGGGQIHKLLGGNEE